VLPGLHVDAQHVMAADARAAGRAWFDVLALADGRAAILVGDVAERGISAAAATVQIRAAFARLLADNNDLTPVIEAINHGVDRHDAAYGTTACLAIVDPIDGHVQYSTCGHPPPLVVAGHGRTRHLRSTGGGSLGTARPVSTETIRLDRDEVLVLFSHGNCPGGRPDLAAAAAGWPDPGTGIGAAQPAQITRSARTEQVCRQTAAELGRAGTRDDFAVLAIQSRLGAPRLELTVPAVVGSLETAGEVVSEWLAGLQSSVEDGAGIALAIGEAVANAIEHAFEGRPTGSIRVEATLLADGMLTCSVRDDGRWLQRETGKAQRRGHGLGLMSRVCDRMLLRHDPGGTVVELRRRLHHPVIRTGMNDAAARGVPTAADKYRLRSV